tara:strand:+ start:263 stop:985 length:723 start_codon:yes stop_codon:yes gene_type:complete
MANETQYDGSEPQEVIDQRSADEAESLQIGEELAQAEQNLLAGKYKDAAELEKAYLELQGKLGERQESSPEEAQEAQEEPSTADLVEKYLAGDKEALEGLSKEDLIEAYKSIRESAEDGDLTDSQVTQIYDSVGGQEEYTSMIKWAQANLSPEQIQAYDSTIDNGDMAQINLALGGLLAKYQDAVGKEGKTIQGNTATETAGYRSQAELLRAMNDPRYDNDPAYRSDVFKKLELSPEIQF